MRKPLKLNLGFFMLLIILYASFISISALAQDVPVGVRSFTYNNTENATITAAQSMATAGGTITTMNLNATSQNPHWKGFAGNVSGKLALEDANGSALYSWTLTTISGEIYSTRTSTVEWTDIDCANDTEVGIEENETSHNSSADDSISNTFVGRAGNHPQFQTAATTFTANQCNYTINTYVNSSAQTTDFYEVILHDDTIAIYTAILENKTRGFDDSEYDFQLLVPENGSVSVGATTTYYFYVELL